MNTIEELRLMHFDKLKELFDSLPATTMAEINGEYLATPLDQGGWFANIVAPLTTNICGRWLGKAFAPLSDDNGHGYNWFQTTRGVRRTLTMKTHVSDSVISPGKSYIVDYCAQHTWLPAMSLFDELRTVSDGVFLGFGVIDRPFWFKALIYPFLLELPQPFVHRVESANGKNRYPHTARKV
jgi:hypothetical protein